MKYRIPYPKDDPQRIYAVRVYGVGRRPKNNLSIYYSPGLSYLPSGILVSLLIGHTNQTTGVNLKVCKGEHNLEIEDPNPILNKPLPKPRATLLEVLNQFAQARRLYLLNADRRPTEHPIATYLHPNSTLTKAIQTRVIEQLDPKDFFLLCDLCQVKVRDLPHMFKLVGTVGAL